MYHGIKATQFRLKFYTINYSINFNLNYHKDYFYSVGSLLATEFTNFIVSWGLVTGPRPMMARRSGPDFPPFFVQRLIHAHAQVCIGFGRAKIDDGEFEFVYHYIIK